MDRQNKLDEMVKLFGKNLTLIEFHAKEIAKETFKNIQTNNTASSQNQEEYIKLAIECQASSSLSQ